MGVDAAGLGADERARQRWPRALVPLVARRMSLVLSVFPGIGLLDMAFEQEGFTVVRGPDVLWGGDIKRFSPPAGVFDGVIGGPPCQAFSRLSIMVRHNGYEPRFGNLIPVKRAMA